MTTGNFANWDGDLTQLGPIYPFVGSEMLMVILAVIFWIVWHILQIRMENRTHDNDVIKLRQGNNLQKAVETERVIERF
jgi:hypothetical protein